MKTFLPLAAAVFALTFSACDDKPKTEEAAPVAPVAQPVVPPAAKPADAHAAAPVKAEEKKDDASGTPDVAAPPAKAAPEELKGQAEKGVQGADAPAKERLGGKIPPPPPPVVEAPQGVPGRTEQAVEGARPGRALPAAFNAKPDGGK